MIVHIVLDDKFGDYIISQFNTVDENVNIFFVISFSANFSNISVKYSNVYSSNINCLFEYLENNKKYISSIVFHGLNEEFKWDVIFMYKKLFHLHWMFWGTDGYMLPCLKKNIFDKKTRKVRRLFSQNKLLTTIVENELTYFFFKKYFFLKHNKIFFLEKLEKAIKNVNSISPVIPDDYYLIKRKLKLNAEMVQFSIGSIDSIVKNIKAGKDGKNILVGNSCSLENNHLDIFWRLNLLDLMGRKIIVPLSYGETYLGLRRLIDSKGYSMFGENYIPLHEFIAVDEYNKILGDCSVAIFNHKKQQAMGNIITLLWLGVKVFINNESPVYNYLKRESLIVYRTCDISQDGLDNPLDELQKANNKKIIEHIYCEKNVFKMTSNLVNYLIR
ncbi:MAG: hypothetical protein D3909_02380 [Candidatus Electrothrix sp. ATG1]|nr:hypothetical protein [Candidatus Electrothrix sp. ATG1]